MAKKLSSWQKYKKRHPEKVALHNRKRRSRTDRSAPTIWHRKLRALMLHCGFFSKMDTGKYERYAHVEIKLSPLEMARLWFRDKAWTMREPELDRIDPAGNYEWSNVRYIERDQNQRRTWDSDENFNFGWNRKESM